MALPAAHAVAAEIKLMCPAPMRTTIVDLVEQFERQSPHKVAIVHTPSRMIIERITGGEAFDVSILTAEATDALIKQGKIARRTDVARSSIGLGVRSGTPKPDVSSAEGVKRSLLAVKSFARNEGAESGKHMLAVFERLGIADEMKAKTKAMPVNTGYVAELVRAAKPKWRPSRCPS
jgi:molybdate transport system substrate-binding protein